MSQINLSTFAQRLEPQSRVRLDCAGRYIRCIDATARFFLSYDGSAKIPFEGSLSHEPEDTFTSFWLHNETDDPIDYVIVVSDGKIHDNRSSFSSTDPIPVLIQQEALAPNASVSRTRLTGDAAAVQIVAENANRRHVKLQNTGASSVWLWVDDQQLFMLEPFENWTFEGRDALKASALVGDGFISVLEV